MLPAPVLLALQSGEPISAISAAHGIPVHALLPYARARSPLAPAQFLQSPRHAQLNLTLAHALRRLHTSAGPDLRAAERLFFLTQSQIDRYHDPILRRRREQEDARRNAARRETFISESDLAEFHVERAFFSRFLHSHPELRDEILRVYELARTEILGDAA